MVNYKRVVCVLAVVATAAVAAPIDCRNRETHFDQRQNGTENYRLNIDGVVIAVAPAETLLDAASDLDFSDLFDLEDLADLQKPKPTPPKPDAVLEPKPEDANPPKPEELPQASKPETPAKPEAPAKPEESLNNVNLNNDVQSQKKEVVTRKQEKAQRLKNRLAHILLPLLRKTRHH